MSDKIMIFLAHAKEDAYLVNRLYEHLEEIGAHPWMAPRDIMPGEHWSTAIRKAISTAHYVIACLSTNSIGKRGYVQREFRLALDICQEMPSAERFLIPLRLDPCEVPELQVGGLNLRDLQWVDSFATGSLKRIISAIGLQNSREARWMLNLYGEDATLSSVLSSPLPWIAYLEEGSGVLTLTSSRLNFSSIETTRALVSAARSPLRILGEDYLETSVVATGVKRVKLLDNEIDGSRLVVIPAGSFLAGDPEVPQLFENQLPSLDVKSVTISTFAISRYLVTNEQFLKFLSAIAYVINPAFKESMTAERADLPVTNVSWIDATMYCEWAGGRLPTEQEWEKAARGIDGRPFPWGWKKPHERYCNYGNPDGGPTTVQKYPLGVSPFGCFDMAGNVWEWTSTQLTPSEIANVKSEASHDLRDKELYIVKGGSYSHPADASRSGGRYYGAKDTRSPLWGFRLAMDITEEAIRVV